MLESLITSKTRIKVLLKFFLNSSSRSYLRNLESEFGESSNAIRTELNKFEEAGLLESELQGNKKFFYANRKHPLFNDIQSILMKHVGVDQIIDNVVLKLGGVCCVYLTGKFAQGVDSRIVDIIIVGVDVNISCLVELIDKVEGVIERKVRYLIFTSDEMKEYSRKSEGADPLLIWQKD